MTHDLEIIRQLEKSLDTRWGKIRRKGGRYRESTYQIDQHQKVTVLQIEYVVGGLNEDDINLILQLEHLTHLKLSACDLTKISPSIENLYNLIDLDISFNDIESLPPEIGKLSKLEKLDLSRNRALTSFPQEFTSLQSLTQLDLWGNDFVAIPPEILTLQNLQKLDLGRVDWPRPLAEIVRQLRALKKLKELALTGIDLAGLPDEIADLRNLDKLSLDLSGKNLRELPPEISDLPYLRELNLSRNSLNPFPKQLTKIPLLEELSLAENSIQAISSEIDELTSLQYLNLTNNFLEELPIEMAALKNLRFLWIPHNKFAEFPLVILNMQGLIVFSIANNYLDNLPLEIRQLKNLRRLYLDKNKLTSLPATLAQLRQLEHLDVTENPLQQPPPEIVSQGTQAILEYLRQILAETAMLNEAKMLIVGQGDVGKTCLANRLVYDTFEQQKSTEGIRILNWEMRAPSDDQEPIKLNAWDFGGQEIYHATHQFFLTKRSLYLLVWNARKSKDYDHIYYWLHTIQTFGGDSPILLVMTKRNERDDDLNMRDLREKFPQIIGCYKVDSEDGSGVPELRAAIREIAWGLPHMRTPWVDSWLRVRERLEKDPRNWIEYSEFRQICAAQGLDAKQSDILDEYLHDLGIIIHFRHNVRLQHMVILKPDWATRAVYQVLDAKNVRAREGVLLHSQLDTIWDTTAYPLNLFPSLLELMNEFELAYELADKKSHLVAELLPSSEPDFTWDAADNLRFYYSYDFLPAGVLTRLIVLLHTYLEPKSETLPLCWREGCVLHWEETRAVVRVKKVEKLIEIRAYGLKKRELLANIRQRFDYIHRSLKNEKISQQIPCGCSPGCSHRFDYEQLIQAEHLGRREVDCPVSWQHIPLSRLLDGYERPFERAMSRAGRFSGEGAIIQAGERAMFFLGNQDRFDFSERTAYMTRQEKVIQIGENANISAPIVAAGSIQNSFNTLAESSMDDEMKQLLDQLLKAVTEVSKAAPPDKAEDAESMARDAESLVKEAASSKPRRRWYEVSLEGLKQAAINLGELAAPVLAIVKKLLPLLLP